MRGDASGARGRVADVLARRQLEIMERHELMARHWAAHPSWRVRAWIVAIYVKPYLLALGLIEGARWLARWLF